MTIGGVGETEARAGGEEEGASEGEGEGGVAKQDAKQVSGGL